MFITIREYPPRTTLGWSLSDFRTGSSTQSSEILTARDSPSDFPIENASTNCGCSDVKLADGVYLHTCVDINIHIKKTIGDDCLLLFWNLDSCPYCRSNVGCNCRGHCRYRGRCCRRRWHYCWDCCSRCSGLVLCFFTDIIIIMFIIICIIFIISIINIASQIHAVYVLLCYSVIHYFVITDMLIRNIWVLLFGWFYFPSPPPSWSSYLDTCYVRVVVLQFCFHYFVIVIWT